MVSEYFNGDQLAANVWLTKYALKDGDGNIVTPVARVRIDEFGNEYVVKRPERQRLTKDMMLLQRKSQRRLTKRQRALMQERLKADAEALKATVDVEVSEDGLMEFGEAVEEEE